MEQSITLSRFTPYTFSCGFTTAFRSHSGPILQVLLWWCICIVIVSTQHSQYGSVPNSKCLHPSRGVLCNREPYFWNALVLLSSIVILMPSTIRFKSIRSVKKLALITGLSNGLALRSLTYTWTTFSSMINIFIRTN